jgi:ribA/ribD-fused uncharacterized protein
VITEFRGKTRWLSNFHQQNDPSTGELVAIFFDGDYYATVEHAYQAAKLADRKDRRPFMDLGLKPGDAKRLGAAVTPRPDWRDVNMDIMKALLLQKFSYPDLLSKLADTHNQILIEGNTWGDKFWGQCPDGNGNWHGENHLGKLLMEVRTLLAPWSRT